MKRLELIMLIVIFSVSIFACGGEENIDVSSMNEKDIAVKFVSLLDNEEFKEARMYFDAIMKSAMTESKLKAVWDKIQNIYGEYESIVDTRVEKVDDKGKTYNIVYVNCKTKPKDGSTESKYFILRVILDKDKKVAGLWHQDGESEGQSTGYTIPKYANEESFTEEDFTIQSEACPLPGTLSIPKGEGTFPVAILVHGSGPNDRDETIGPNKPFKDIAYGLASDDIAVLRYEKRTKHCTYWVNNNIYTLTVEDETINDAVKAVEQLKQHDKINPDKIFIVGHSLGANVMPRIAVKVGESVAGVVMLAGNVRPLHKLIVIQSEYIINADGELTQEEKDQLSLIREQVAKIEALDIKEKEIVLGGAKAYWEDFLNYDPIKTAKKVNVPMFIIQGERDYQVTMEEFNLWKEGLSDKEQVTFKSYPALNHLLMEGEGKSTPDEYNKANNVSKQVIVDLRDWIDAL
jgi:uncharacterized protein